jgi:endonuclease/exonuclease/phosphatase family metal-dependent hydrolase
MIALVMVSILWMSYWAVRMSREKAWRGYGPCFRAPRDPGDRRKNKDQLSIVNFNAEWLFLRGGSGQIVCPSESCPWATKDEARNHLKQVAQVITALDADIYNLNEVENCSVLDDLLSFLPEDHGYRFYLVNGEDSATGQNPAILTRLDPIAHLRHSKMRVEYPLPGCKCKYGELGVTGAAKHYATRFRVLSSRGSKTEFVMAGFHFLAKPKDLRRCARREAQAAIVRDVVENMRKPGDLVILAGDCNDFDNQVPGADGQKSITRVLEILRESAGEELVNAAAHVPQAQRYSSWFDYDQNCIDNGPGEHSLIDHVLLSREWQVQSASFHHAYNVSCRSRVSDHWPFKVVLRLD